MQRVEALRPKKYVFKTQTDEIMVKIYGLQGAQQIILDLLEILSGFCLREIA